jgi:hypothetical protein
MSAAIARARYQGLAAARRWQHDPARPREQFTLSVGDRVGELTVIGHLARGRCTELYQVWSNRHWCALTGKLVMPDHVQGGVAPVSFRREAEVLEKLRHPNIVRLFGSEVGEERPYILLEYLAGPSLFDVLEGLPKRRLHIPDAVRAVMHVGAAVHYLHRCGYLYRDLKPGNIHLREGVPVLLDFDVVRELEPVRRPADRLGTAPYMAPEQVLREPLTAATDVYGMGALLYELVTGKWPTRGAGIRGRRRRLGRLGRRQRTAGRAERAAGGRRRRTDDPGAGAALSAAPPAAVPAPRASAGAPARAGDGDPAGPGDGPRGALPDHLGDARRARPMLKGRHRLWPENAPVERRADTDSR